jgi:hypothetical protein
MPHNSLIMLQLSWGKKTYQYVSTKKRLPQLPAFTPCENHSTSINQANNRTIYPVEYQTFCRQNGKHLNLFNEPVDWNSELIEGMRLGLSEKWKSLESSLSQLPLERHGSIEGHIRELRVILLGEYIAKVMKE